MRPIVLRRAATATALVALLASAAVAGAAAQTPGAPDDQALAEELRTSLRIELLEPWYPRAVDTDFGGYLSDFAYDWEPQPPQDKFIVTQARHVWTTARAAEFFPEKRDAYLEMGRHGFDFLRTHMWDDQYGGFLSLVTRKGVAKSDDGGFTQGKTAYGNAFGIYGLAAYHQVSGDAQALELAREAFRWLDRHAHDPEYGGYFQFVERDGTPLPTGRGEVPPKDQNSSIHLLEAFTELYRVWPDSVLRSRLHEMLRLVRDTIRTDPGYLQLFFQRDWTPLSYRDSSEVARQEHVHLDHVSFGHDVETAYLMLEAAHALGLDPAPTLRAGKQMVDHALDHGWDAEVGGFFDGAYYTEPGAPPEIVLDTKAWWAQAEALNTMLLMARRFPDDPHDYYERFLDMWAYIREYLIDHEHGGWYVGGLDRRPEVRTAPKGGIWKGAYHDGRALMNVVRELEDGTFTLDPLYQNGMVMQRGAEVPVSGTAAPGAEVDIAFDGETFIAHADDDGRWGVRLPPMGAGGPHTMTVSSEGVELHVRDILVGDVWIASGQSNMEWAVADANDAEREIATAGDSGIRHFKVPHTWAYAPGEKLGGGAWEPADPEHVGSFSAVGYFFARELGKHVDVPIGLINTSWGGSRIEPWMSANALGYEEGEVDAIRRRAEEQKEAALDALREKIGDLPAEDRGLSLDWEQPAYDDSAWSTIAVPGAWEDEGYAAMDGVGWYRTTFTVSPSEAQAGVRIGVGTIDDNDVTWVNGHEVGRTNSWNATRVYAVPPSALHPVENVLVVRVEDTGGGGGIYGDPDLLYLEAGGERRPLSGVWRFKVGEVSVNFESRTNHMPTLLYNQMIYPLQDYPIKGVIWYQGESNANSVEDAEAYRKLFADLITSWRQEWGQGDFPFLWVQLANFMQEDEEPPAQSNWAILRASQSAALSLPQTAEAVIIDIGEADDIHPRNKQDVGARLARAARRIAYGESDLVYSGPRYREHRVEGDRVIVEFDHVGSGLTVRGDELRGFAIAGEDGTFIWADAEVEGDRVVVWSDRVDRPVAVRYAWANNPGDANLYNEEGLPAAPFRTEGPR